MLYDTYDNPKLIPFKDEQEEQQIKELALRNLTLSTEVFGNALSGGRGITEQDRKEFRQYHRQVAQLHKKLLYRYISSFPDSPERGLQQDIIDIIDSISPQELSDYVARMLENADNSTQIKPGYKYTAAYLVLISTVKAQLLSINLINGDTSAAEALVANKAARLYDKIDGEVTPQMLYPTSKDAGNFADEERDILTISEIKNADTYLYTTNKISQKLTSISLSGQSGVMVDVGGGATVTAMSAPPAGEQITDDDREVLLAVADLVSRAHEKPLKLTPAQIYRAFAGKDSNFTVSPEKQQQMVTSIDKLMRTEMTIDFKQQIEKHTRIKKRADFDYSRTRLDGYAISGYKATSSRGFYHGVELQTDVVYVINDMPLVVEYSRAMGQVAQFSKKYLTAEVAPTIPAKAKDSNKTASTHRLTMIRRALAAQIERIKSTNKRKKDGDIVSRLTYETIAEKAGLLPLTPETRRKLRDTVDDVLEAYTKTRPRLIKSYAKYKDGRKFVGVEIRL